MTSHKGFDHYDRLARTLNLALDAQGLEIAFGWGLKPGYESIKRTAKNVVRNSGVDNMDWFRLVGIAGGIKIAEKIIRGWSE